MKTCAICKTKFEEVRSTAMYCSTACKRAGDKLTYRKRYKTQRGELTPRQCKWCETTFTPKQRHGMFCSSVCRRSHNRIFPGGSATGLSDVYQVTTPYGSHGFDSFIAASYQRRAQCSLLP